MSGPSKLHIQHELNLIQHRDGYLNLAELKALSARAEAMGERLPLHRLHEVASFFPHYRFTQPEGIEVRVCRDMTCHLKGGPECRDRLERLARELTRAGAREAVTVSEVSCL